MRVLFALLFVLAAPPALAGPGHSHHDMSHSHQGASELEVLRTELADTLAQIQVETRAVRDLLSAGGSPGVQRVIDRKLARIEDLTRSASDLGVALARLAESSLHMPPPTTVVVVEQPSPPVEVVVIDDRPLVEPEVIIIDEGPIACSSSEHSKLLRAVGDESFDDGKIRVLAEVAQRRWFTVGQVLGFMELMSFGDQKVEAAALLHSHTVDLENWYRVYGALTFDSNKDALRQRVGG